MPMLQATAIGSTHRKEQQYCETICKLDESDKGASLRSERPTAFTSPSFRPSACPIRRFSIHFPLAEFKWSLGLSYDSPLLVCMQSVKCLVIEASTPLSFTTAHIPLVEHLQQLAVRGPSSCLPSCPTMLRLRLCQPLSALWDKG